MRLNLFTEARDQLKVVRALNKIRVQTPNEFEVFRTLLVSASEELNRQLRKGEGAALHRVQGRAQELDELIRLMDSSMEIQKDLIDNISREQNTHD